MDNSGAYTMEMVRIAKKATQGQINEMQRQIDELKAYNKRLRSVIDVILCVAVSRELKGTLTKFIDGETSGQVDVDMSV
jgi:DNA topoisomerase IA